MSHHPLGCCYQQYKSLSTCSKVSAPQWDFPGLLSYSCALPLWYLTPLPTVYSHEHSLMTSACPSALPRAVGRGLCNCCPLLPPYHQHCHPKETPGLPHVIGFMLLTISENTAGATLNYLIEASGFKLFQFAINNEKHADFSYFFNMKALKCFMDLYPHHSKFWLTIRQVFNNHKWNSGFHSGLGRL